MADQGRAGLDVIADAPTDRETEIIDGLIEHARALAPLVQPGMGEYHLRTLLKIRDWAVAQQPHQPGAAVKMRRTLDIDRSSGWYPYRHLLVQGSAGVVDQVWFNGAHDRWIASVRFDGDIGLFALDPDDLEAR